MLYCWPFGLWPFGTVLTTVGLFIVFHGEFNSSVAGVPTAHDHGRGLHCDPQGPSCNITVPLYRLATHHVRHTTYPRAVVMSHSRRVGIEVS